MFLLLFTFKIWVFIVIGAIIALVMISREKRPKEYSDTFRSPTELSRFNKGIQIGSGRTTRDSAMVHTGLVSPSGGGKTSTVLLPTALNLDNCSVVCLDPAREIFEKTSGAFLAKNFRVLVLDFHDIVRSISFNPLLRAKTNMELSMLAEMIFAPSMRNSKDIFWPMMGAKLLTLLFKIQKRLPEEFQNLANTLHLVNMFAGDPDSMDKLFSKHADDKLFQEYKGMISHDQKLLSNLIATCQSALNIFDTEEIACLTAKDTLDLKKFREVKTVLYIHIDIMSARYFSFLAEILFTQMFTQFMSKIPDKENDCFVLMDELGSITIKGLPEALSNLRKYRVSVCYAIQSKAQLIERYGREDARTILANTYHQVIFPGMETEVAKDLETRLGRWSFERPDGTTGSRELMTVSELISLEEGYAMYVAGPNRPVKIKLKPYYKNPLMMHKASLPPAQVIGDVAETINYINVEQHLRVVA